MEAEARLGRIHPQGLRNEWGMPSVFCVARARSRDGIKLLSDIERHGARCYNGQRREAVLGLDVASRMNAREES